MNKEKLMKFAKEMDSCAKTAEIVAWVMGGILLLVSMLMIGSKDYGGAYSVISLDYLTLNLTEEARLPLEVQKFKLESFIIALFPLMGFIIYASRLCRKILKPMKEGRPFEAQCSKGIKRLGNLVLIAGIAFQMIKNILTYRNFINYDMAALFVPEKISQVVFKVDFNVGFLWVGLVLYLLSYVFKYGEVLQQESDETL